MATGHGKIDPKFDNFLRSPLFNYFSLRLTVRVQYYCQSVFGKFPMPFFRSPQKEWDVFFCSLALYPGEIVGYIEIKVVTPPSSVRWWTIARKILVTTLGSLLHSERRRTLRGRLTQRRNLRSTSFCHDSHGVVSGENGVFFNFYFHFLRLTETRTRTHTLILVQLFTVLMNGDARHWLRLRSLDVWERWGWQRPNFATFTMTRIRDKEKIIAMI